MPDFFLLIEEPENDEPEVRRLPIANPIAARLEEVLQEAKRSIFSPEIEQLPFTNEIYDPDETEAWVIEDFVLPEHIAVAIEDPLGCPTMERLEAQVAAAKGLIVSWHGGQELVLQVLDRRNVLMPGGLTLIHQQETFRQLDDAGLLLKDDVHAVVMDGRLYFRKMYWMRRLFDMSAYYVAATDADVEDFAGHESILVSDREIYHQNSDTWVRKRMAAVLESGILDDADPGYVADTAQGYDVHIETIQDGGREKIVVPAEKSEMKKLLKLLEEEYYDGPLTDTQYVANSKRRLPD